MHDPAAVCRFSEYPGLDYTDHAHSDSIAGHGPSRLQRCPMRGFLLLDAHHRTRCFAIPPGRPPRGIRGRHPSDSGPNNSSVRVTRPISQSCDRTIGKAPYSGSRGGTPADRGDPRPPVTRGLAPDARYLGVLHTLGRGRIIIPIRQCACPLRPAGDCVTPGHSRRLRGAGPRAGDRAGLFGTFRSELFLENDEVGGRVRIPPQPDDVVAVANGQQQHRTVVVVALETGHFVPLLGRPGVFGLQ